MKTDKPTPIPRRASARKDPKPIEFPAPRPVQKLPAEAMFDEEIETLVKKCVHEALREHDKLLIHTFYKVVMDWPLAEIMCMGEAEFEARCRSILEDEE